MTENKRLIQGSYGERRYLHSDDDGINRYRINKSNFIVEILDDGIPMHYSTIVNRLNEQHKTITRLEEENGQLKQRIKELEVENEAQSDAIDGLQEFMAHHDLEGLE